MRKKLKTVIIIVVCLFGMSGILGLVNRGTVEDREPTQGQTMQQERHKLYDMLYHEDGQRRDLRERQ